MFFEYSLSSNKNDLDENDNYSLTSKPSSGLKKKDENLLEFLLMKFLIDCINKKNENQIF